MTEPMTPIPQDLLDEAHEIMDQFNALMSHDCRVDIIAQALAKERERLRTIWIERCDRASAMARDFEQLAWERGKRIAELERPAPSRQLPEDVQELIERLHVTSHHEADILAKAAAALEQMAQEIIWWKAMAAQVDGHVARIDELEAELSSRRENDREAHDQPHMRGKL
jgi:hypothetical protein